MYCHSAFYLKLNQFNNMNLPLFIAIISYLVLFANPKAIKIELKKTDNTAVMNCYVDRIVTPITLRENKETRISVVSPYQIYETKCHKSTGDPKNSSVFLKDVGPCISGIQMTSEPYQCEIKITKVNMNLKGDWRCEFFMLNRNNANQSPYALCEFNVDIAQDNHKYPVISIVGTGLEMNYSGYEYTFPQNREPIQLCCKLEKEDNTEYVMKWMVDDNEIEPSSSTKNGNIMMKYAYFSPPITYAACSVVKKSGEFVNKAMVNFNYDKTAKQTAELKLDTSVQGLVKKAKNTYEYTFNDSVKDIKLKCTFTKGSNAQMIPGPFYSLNWYENQRNEDSAVEPVVKVHPRDKERTIERTFPLERKNKSVKCKAEEDVNDKNANPWASVITVHLIYEAPVTTSTLPTTIVAAVTNENVLPNSTVSIVDGVTNMQERDNTDESGSGSQLWIYVALGCSLVVTVSVLSCCLTVTFWKHKHQVPPVTVNYSNMSNESYHTMPNPATVNVPKPVECETYSQPRDLHMLRNESPYAVCGLSQPEITYSEPYITSQMYAQVIKKSERNKPDRTYANTAPDDPSYTNVFGKTDYVNSMRK